MATIQPRDLEREKLEREQEKLDPEKYADRNAVEVDILTVDSDEVQLDIGWKGSKVIKVPRVSVHTFYAFEPALEALVRKLDPNVSLNLFLGNQADIERTVYEIFDLWFNQIGREIMSIIKIVLEINEEEWDKFDRFVTPVDALSIFSIIVNDSLANPRMRAILKKVVSQLFEKSALESGS